MSDDRPRHIVIMGVSGCGKSTVAHGLRERLGLAMAEADEFHSARSVALMRNGSALEDADRLPWLRQLADWIAARDAEGCSTVLACSALRRSYRDLLRAAAPGVYFIHLHGPAALIQDRLFQRAGHFMPPSLLDSQLTTLEPLQPDEAGTVLDVSQPPDDLVETIVGRLRLSTPEVDSR